MVKSHSRVRIPLTPYFDRAVPATSNQPCERREEFVQRIMRFPIQRGLVFRLLLLAIAFPIAYFVGASASFYYRQRIINTAEFVHSLPNLDHPDAATRLLVFAPHCDDETLGCAGLIQQTIQAGGKVKVVIITNGDGYPAAVKRQERVLKAAPRDFVHFASLRQSESRAALSSLGVPPESVSFLGYPDGGLMALWSTYWSSLKPYTSRFTECSRSPYTDTYSSASDYSGEDLTRDIAAEMRQFHPTIVTVTHPSEDHTDHSAAGTFVTLALKQLSQSPSDSEWASQTLLRHYLIHRGDWPTPQGDHPDLPLVPPISLTRVDTDWSLLQLTADQVRKKAMAMERYPSQTLIMPGFLTSFQRRNELYGTIANRALPVVKERQIRLNGALSDWQGVPPAILDPVRDNGLRDLQGGADIAAVYCARDTDNLYIRITTRCPVSSRYRYSVHLRPFDTHWSTPDTCGEFTVEPGKSASSSIAVSTGTGDKSLVAIIPLSLVCGRFAPGQVRALGIWVDTQISSVEIDRTEIRILDLSGIPVTSPGSSHADGGH